MERWVGKVAVVTGASSGIGASIAEDLVRNGMVVVGFARREERLKELARKLSGEKGKLHPVKVNICNEDEVTKAFKWIKQTFGTLHVLVNCAGIFPLIRLSEINKQNEIRQLFETNVIALSLCTGKAISLMKETGVDDGHIIHISSYAGQVIIPLLGYHAYGSTKHAVRVLTEGLRRELIETGSKIRVTCINPGLVKTEILQASGASNDLYQNPYLNAKDISDCVLFALQMPPHVQIHELTVKPIGEAF